MKRSRIFLAVIFLLLTAASFLTIWARHTSEVATQTLLPERRQVVAALLLTDLSLWSEARYTRNPAMADLFSPFQDAPGSMEHFPAGALLAPALPLPDTTVRIRRVAEPIH